ncbi:hypothetical protein [Reyranella sp.]|uniref:hypothetical protein n=1 Tax=Reyranella sp. TaxID=1929291 RepID=UPI000BD96C47|nr:hypothetical protein [Reyranella sp.]OYY38298.1 MAG: hypothetical protein B7Y57_22060 [Rhodospirillales bacterium 35-66-84]OYZ92041.1 MAG: hypothetical protein B7Y08_23555 [Rhodospirillales bacterium 24-66-33]OZB23404.1 MAG: hypothetical protein B7X63_19815 [Rhodospirillales bacterium 39-66-50]HQS17705.1 hypothetical protein [Reyranella sp.]HQT14449.1 hypothetical protein [Reyranella sp.]
MTSAVSVAFDPLLPWTVLAVLGAVGLVLVLLGLRARARGTIWRLGSLVVVLAALANPSLIEEQRKPIADVALVVVDDSDSMAIGERRQQVQAARESLKRKLGQQDGLEVREVVLPPSQIQLGSERPGGTRLIDAMRSALIEIPQERLAGVVLLSDGQVHDVPAGVPPELGGAPVHALIAGRKNERDRLIVLEQSPRYGVVGREVTTKFRIEDPAGGTAPVTLSVGGEVVKRIDVPVGRSVELPITVGNPGANVVELEVGPGTSELTLDNNRALFTINGVRDRLRVLLVSGEPYQGERAWRNLLKSDPAVDLVHFTILRTPQKDDFTPVRELSLIVFPMRELFEQKLKEFDLIIFDRYESGNLITRDYFRNITEYVKGGGALLVSVGPVFATQRSLYRTPLGAILPGAPTGDVVETGFKPKVTEIGQRHPVTANLPQAGDPNKEPEWGRWFRLVTSRTERGNAVLAGAEEKPLVILDRVGEGRVAQLLSDHLWLWNRGIDGGGPQPELVRRVAHWLMKEPDLEEEALRATAVGGRIEITRRTLATTFPQVTMTSPGGATRTLDLRQTAPGLGVAVVDVDKPGLYRFDDGTLRAVAAVGSPDPLEFSDVRATDTKLKPLVEATGGGLMWLADQSDPDIRTVRPGRAAGGSDWIGLRRNEGYTVAGINQLPLLPGILVALAFLMAIASAWWREGR